MPPALHPRSRMTTSLFTTTLAISFLVVAAPHILPCPVDRRALADSADPDALNTDPNRRRRRRRKIAQADGEVAESVEARPEAKGVLSEMRTRIQEEDWKAPKRECPVPKPGGLIGQVLGVKKEGDQEAERK